ncbi:MAG: hypothetical protein GY866_17420, partial [Proteobacteria bacterium]|nr:hypothetical protein [Pseudomonadota bacterium]
MTTKQKLLGPIIILSLIICAMFLATLWISEQQKNDEFVINLAGRQRMLTQKMTKELLLLRSEWVKNGKSAERTVKQLEHTIAVFDKTLNALIYSGDAPLNFTQDNIEFRHCPAAVDPALSQLEKVRSIWLPFAVDLVSIIGNSADAEERIESVLKNNISLLSAMDRAVEIMQIQSEERGKLLVLSQVVGITISLCFALFGIIVINRVTNLRNAEITERKKAEVELRKSEQNLTKAQALVHLGSWKLDVETMNVTGSDELFNIFGLNGSAAPL